MTGCGNRRRDRAPEKIARPEAVKENYRGSSMSVPLDMDCSGTDGSSQDVSLHLNTPLLAFASPRSSSRARNQSRKMPANNDPPRARNVSPRNSVREAQRGNRSKAFLWIL